MPPKPKPTSSIPDVLRIFWKSTSPHKGSFFFILLCFTITSSLQIIDPIFYKMFFDKLQTSTTYSPDILAPQLLHIIYVILAINATSWLIYRAAMFMVNRFQTNVIADLKQQAFTHLLGHSYNFFSNNFTGALTQRVNRLAFSFERLSDRLFFNVIPLITSITGISIVVWNINPFFTLVILVWMFGFMSFNYAFSRFKLKYDLQNAETNSKVTALLSDDITNHNAIQLFGALDTEYHAYQKVTAAEAKITNLTWNLSSIVDGVQASLIFIVEFLLFYFALKYWQVGLITIGSFVLIQVYFISLGSRLWDFSRLVRDLYQSFANAKEMVDIMLLPHEIRDIPTATILKVSKGEVRFDEISFNFNETRTILSDFSLTIPGGQRVALIGPSGAGKSTLVKLLLRLYEVGSGSITIDGTNIKNVTQDSLRNHMSLVPQDPVLFHRSLMENIRYGRTDATDAEVFEAARLAHCDEFVQDLPLKYETFVGERGIKLSGGERQRVAIARAILKNAPILILDEATSSLDSESEGYIQDALDTLMKGKTTIVIAHRLSTIRKMDRILVIDEGNIIEDGTHEALIKKPDGLYARLWSLQAGGFIG